MMWSVWVFWCLSNLRSRLCNLSKAKVTLSSVEKDILKLELLRCLFPWNFCFWFPSSFCPPPPTGELTRRSCGCTHGHMTVGQDAASTTSSVSFLIPRGWNWWPQSLTEYINFSVKNRRTKCRLLLIMGAELSGKLTRMTSPWGHQAFFSVGFSVKLFILRCFYTTMWCVI